MLCQQKKSIDHRAEYLLKSNGYDKTATPYLLVTPLKYDSDRYWQEGVNGYQESLRRPFRGPIREQRRVVRREHTHRGSETDQNR